MVWQSLLVLHGVVAASACGAIHDGVSYYGGDHSHSHADSIDDCCQICCMHSGIDAFSWNSGGNHLCYCKVLSETAPQAVSGVTSGTCQTGIDVNKNSTLKIGGPVQPELTVDVEVGRTKLPAGQGCYILSKDRCCGFIDGRTDADDVLDQPCLPAKSKFPSGNECEPTGVVYNHGWQGDKATCTGEAQSTLKSGAPVQPELTVDVEVGRTKLPAGQGCYILSKDRCCGFIDGRTDADDVLDQPCLPAKSKFPSGNECEPTGVVYNHGWQGDKATCTGEAQSLVANETDFLV